MKEKTAQKILAELKNNYNRIAEKFFHTRKKIWPFLKDFSQYVKEGDKVLDVGCGTGRLLAILKDKKIRYTGIDFSEKLIEFAKKENPSFQNSFKTINFFDFPEKEKYNVIFMIAFLHHIPSKKLRQEAILKAYRLLEKDGILIISVWNLWTRKYFKYILKALIDKIIFKKDLEFFDAFIPWEGTVSRFYHAFLFFELKKLIKENGFKILKAVKTKEKQSNFYLIAQKN